jgi:predicted P-loop ATPase
VTKSNYDVERMLERVDELLKHGYHVTPARAGTKTPMLKDWQMGTTPVDIVRHYVTEKQANVGIVNGKISSGAIDVDIDTPEGALIATEILPATPAIFGRPSNPNSHRLYRFPSGTLPPTVRHKLATKTLAELRTDRTFTLAPGSVHPSGEMYEGSVGTPAIVDPAELLECFNLFTAGIVLVKSYPQIGSRHDFALALGGALAQAGVSYQSSSFLAEVVANASNDNEVRDRLRAIEDSYDKFAAGRRVMGRRFLEQHMGKAGAQAFYRVLDLHPVRDDDEGEKTRSVIPNLKRNREGEPKNSRDTVKRILKYDDAWLDVLGFDELKQEPVLMRQPPITASGPYPVRLTDTHLLKICDWLCNEHDANVSMNIAKEGVVLVCLENAFNPVVEYLRGARDHWDGKPRLDGMLATYFCVPESPYASAVGKKWMISAVARALRPGCKADTMLVVEGPQGIRKSTSLAVLGGEFFAADPPSIRNDKEFREWCHGNWIIEISELEAMRKAQSTQTKSMLSVTEDRYRSPYAQFVENRKRAFVFAATTNEPEYLLDATGGRRFWPVTCEGRIDTDALERDRDQLWGEAMHLFEAGEIWHLTPEEEELAEVEQRKRIVVDPLDTTIADLADRQASLDEPVKTDVLVTLLNLRPDVGRLPNNIRERIGRTLAREGWAHTRSRKHGWHYVKRSR